MDNLWIATDEGFEASPVRLLRGRPLGAARTCDTTIGRGVPGVIRRLGGAQISHRYLVAGRAADQQEVCAVLTAARTRSIHYDPVWLTLDPVDGAADTVVFALTRAQVEAFDRWQPPVAAELANGQSVTTVDVRTDGWWGRDNTYELVPWTRPADEPADDSWIQLQSAPSSPFAKVLGRPNTYYCVLHPDHRPRVGTGLAVVANPYLEADYGGLLARFPLLIAYNRDVPRTKIVLDQTISTAIGLRDGEPVLVRRGPKRRLSTKSVFGFRHTVCRVIPATTLDQEKPIIRLPIEAFDVLGIPPGSRVVVEGLAETSHSTLRRVSARALEEREGRLPLISGVPDTLDTAGSVDLPIAALDFAMREELGISRGSAVYVRPAILSVVTDEFSSVSLVLLAATLGSFVSDQLLISAVLIVIYLALAMLYVLRRLR